MSIFKRIANAFARPEHETMAGIIGERLTRVLAELSSVEHQAALEELRTLDQEVSAFVEKRGTSELRLAVEHWALSGRGRGDLVTHAASFLADNDIIKKLLGAISKDGHGGLGLVWLQEAFNEAGLIMGPTIHDHETGPMQEIIRRTLAEVVTGKATGPRSTMEEIADVLWPETDEENALRSRIARASGASTARVTAELFAVRWYALGIAHDLAFPDPAKRDPMFGSAVYLALGSRLQGNEHIKSESWLPRGADRYPPTGQEFGDAPWRVESTQWLARIGAVFETALGKEGSEVGLLGAAQFDLALTRLKTLMTPPQ